MNPHEMTDDALCRAVAVEVMGWRKLYTTNHPREEDRNFRWTDGEDPHIGSFWKLDWDSAGRVVEAMYELELYLDAKAQDPKVRLSGHTIKKYEVDVWGVGSEGTATDLLAVSRSDSLPRAVFEAALLAKRAGR